MYKVRVLRILEYVGDRQWVENQMNKGGVPMVGQKEFGIEGLQGIIKSTVVDQFPETVEPEPEEEIIDCSNCQNYWHHSSSMITEMFCTLDDFDKVACQLHNFKYHTKK